MRSARGDFPDRCCTTCRSFTLKGQPGEADGRGLCTMYERTESWDWDRCVIYTPAGKTMGERLQELKVLRQKAATPRGEQDGHKEVSS